MSNTKTVEAGDADKQSAGWTIQINTTGGARFREIMNGDWPIAHVYGSTEQSEASARLIAAAPDLFEALKYANRYLRKQDVDKAFIEAAIAKAEKGAQ